MCLNSERDLGRAPIGIFNVADEALAFEAEHGSKLFLGERKMLAIVDDPHGAGCSHITNFGASPLVRTGRADFQRRLPHNAGMARRGIPKEPSFWYLREWMAAKGMKGRGAQAKMRELTGWPRATMSDLYNHRQDFSPKILKEAAEALGVEPYELLMHPDHAMALLRLRKDALTIVESSAPLDERTGTTG